MSVNKVIILGRLGQDPEVRYTATGSAVANFSMATSENWTDKSGQKQERTEWHRIVVWGKLAELCGQYLSKGRQAFVEGKIQTRSWEDQQGQKRYTTEINASTVQFIGARGESTQQQSQNMSGSSDFSTQPQAPMEQQSQNDFQVNSNPSFTADDIPF